MNGEGVLFVRVLDEGNSSAVALTGEASLRCLKYLWPRSRRFDPRSGQSPVEIGRVRSSPYGELKSAPEPPKPRSAGRTSSSGSSDEAPESWPAPSRA